MNCIRFLDYKSLAEVDRLTIPEYRLLMEGVKLKLVDLDYRGHLLAWLIRAVKAEKGKGKHIKPVFTKFKQFYDYKAEIAKIEKKKGKKSKYDGIGKLLSKGD